MAKLLVQESGAEAREFELVDAEVHIGRELDNALRIPDPSISRHHCVIRRTGAGFEIQDLQSSNGVLLNGNRVQTSPLKHGDRVTLGQIHITFDDPAAASAPDEGATVAIQSMGNTNPAGTVRMTADQMAAIHAGAPAPAAPPSVPSVPPVAPPPPPPTPQAPQFGHFTDPGQAPAPTQGASMNDTTGKPFNDEDKIHLFLAYFGLLSLIPFLMFKDKRDDPQKEYVYWHARQGLALAITVFVLWIPLMVIWFIPFLGWIIGCLGYIFLIVLGLGGAIMGWIKAFGGEKWNIPLISKFAGMLG